MAFSNSQSAAATRRFNVGVFLMSAFAVIVGGAGLLGWTFHISLLKSIRPDWVAIKANTAVGILALGLGLLIAQKKKQCDFVWRFSLEKLFSGIAFVIGFTTLVEYLTKIDLKIDQLLFIEPAYAVGTFSPGRMALNTAISLLCLGAGVFFIDYETPVNRRRPSQYLALVGLILTLPSIIIYIYGNSFLAGIAPYTQMAIQTAVALALVSTGVLLARPNRGFILIVFNQGPAGIISRKLFPAVFVVPVVFGAIALKGARAGIYDLDFALTLTVIACIVIWTFVVASTAKGVLDLDRSRVKSESEKNRLAVQREGERALFEAVLETMPSALIVAEAPSGRLIYGNPQMNKVWRHEMIESKELSEYIMWKGFHPDGTPFKATDWPLARTIMHGVSIMAEDVDVLRGDGTRGIIRLSSSPIRNNAGTVTGGIVICEDVTEIIRTQNELVKSETRLRNLTEALPQIVWTAAPDGTIDYCNQQWFDYTGLDKITRTSGEWAPLVHAEDLARTSGAWAEAIATGNQFESETRLRRASDGSYRWHLIRGVATRDEKGAIIKWFGSSTDIEEQKAAETERIQLVAEQHAAVAVRDREARLRSIFESAFEAIISNTADGTITEWNPKAEDIFLIPRNEALGKKIHELIIPPHYRAGFLRDTRAFLETGHGPLLNKTIELTAIRRNGEQFPIQLSVGVLRNGGDYLFTSFIDDITLRKRNEVELISARQSALDAARLKSEFLANMSHEIRTPLNGIIGIAELLHDTPLSPEQEKFVSLIQDSGSNLLTIINDVLDFSKIEAGRLNFESIEFSPSEVLRNKVEVLSYKARKKGLSIEVAIDSAIPSKLLGDPGRLGQVLLNLLGNAIKFTDAGRIAATVRTVQISGENTKLRFEISDSGIGLDPVTIANLFQPFVQADGSTARRYGGTGLGLSISKRLVAQMNGEIGVESSKGKGSTFWFTASFACAASNSAHFLEPQVLKFSKSGDADESPIGKRILIAEDNPTNQLLTLTQLRNLGYSAVAVSNGLEAVDAFKTGEFDLILMDCQMPSLDGFEATRIIRQIEKYLGQRMPILALTANAMKEDADNCRAAGMDDHIPKPVKKEFLAKKLEEWIFLKARAAG